MGTRLELGNLSTNEIARVAPGGTQHESEQRGGRGFAVGASHRHRAGLCADPPQHLRARPNGLAGLASCDKFHVGFSHRRRVCDDFTFGNRASIVWHIDDYPQRSQAIHSW